MINNYWNGLRIMNWITDLTNIPRDENKKILMTVQSGDYKRKVIVALYSNEDYAWHNETDEYGDVLYYDDRIIAWMPMIEPYVGYKPMKDHKYVGTVRLVVYRDCDRWSLAEDEYTPEIIYHGMVFDSISRNGDQIIDEEICSGNIIDIMNAVSVLAKFDVIPFQYYEIFGTFVVEWYHSNSYEYPDEWDCEFWFENVNINMIPYKVSKELGFVYGSPIPIQCA